MADDDPMLEVGRIGRAHGLAGEVSVVLTTNVESRLTPGSELCAGHRVLVVAAVRPHQGRWLVRFEGCSDRAAAEGLRGTVLTAPAARDPDDPEALFVHDLIGATVVDAAGRPLGEVTEVVENPASDLLALSGGALVPLAFVASADDGLVTLVEDLPDGLFDL